MNLSIATILLTAMHACQARVKKSLLINMNVFFFAIRIYKQIPKNKSSCNSRYEYKQLKQLKLFVLFLFISIKTRQTISIVSIVCIHILNCKMTSFFGICFFLYFLKLLAGRGSWTIGICESSIVHVCRIKF